MEIKAITRKWGKSTIKVKKKRPKTGALFGRFPELRITSTQRLKDGARRGWDSESDRKRESQAF